MESSLSWPLSVEQINNICKNNSHVNIWTEDMAWKRIYSDSYNKNLKTKILPYEKRGQLLLGKKISDQEGPEK